jgi:hypothetical protein
VIEKPYRQVVNSYEKDHGDQNHVNALVINTVHLTIRTIGPDHCANKTNEEDDGKNDLAL